MHPQEDVRIPFGIQRKFGNIAYEIFEIFVEKYYLIAFMKHHLKCTWAMIKKMNKYICIYACAAMYNLFETPHSHTTMPTYV